MRTAIPVPLGERAYDIILGPDLLSHAAEFFEATMKGRQVLLACDGNVAELHGAKLHASLEGAGYRVETLTLPPGENTKNAAHLGQLWDKLSAARFGRDSIVVAVGGGVAGDLVGFAAASYMRGVDFVQVPTSLLAMVDSSVGGKTGINHPLAKNLIGAFWQPRLVLADTDTLKTLPEAECVSALAEIIKYGVIYDADFFAWLEQNIGAVRRHDPEALVHAIKRSCEIKADVVTQDERENGLRAILNFGHTLGHAIENSAGYGVYRHGEAIAIGMVAESQLAMRMGAVDWGGGEHDRLVALIEAAGLPVRLAPGHELTIETLIAAARSDKKNRGGQIHYALPIHMGLMQSCSLPESEAEAVLLGVGAST